MARIEVNNASVSVYSSNENIVEDSTVDLLPGQVRLETIISSRVFQDQVALIGPEFVVRSINIQGVTMFGPRPGFVYFQADVVDQEGKPVPGAVFARGDSVAMLIELVCKNERFALMINQLRFPAGRSLMETAAGMLDGTGDFKGVAFKEIEEEVPALKGLFTLDHVKQLNAKPIWLTPGGSGERMGFFHLKLVVDRTTLDAIRGTVGGLGSEGEKTIANIAPWEDLPQVTDGKLLIALGYYNLQVEIPALQARIKDLETELLLLRRRDHFVDEDRFDRAERLRNLEASGGILRDDEYDD